LTQATRREAFEARYREQEGPLFNIVYRWVWHEQEALDLVQEAFCRVWERCGAWEIVQLKPYLYRTALNLAANHRRQRRLWKWTGFDVAARDLQREAGPDPCDEREAQVRTAIDTLPKRFKDVLLLHRFSGLPQAEVARILAIPVGTVASRHHKALKLLKKKLLSTGLVP